MESKGIRISAGELRGKTISVPAGLEVRPMRSRVRESLFSILGDRVRGARVLDVFAGSGSLSIEALSRGSSTAVLIESAPYVLEVLRQNLARLNLAARARVIAADAHDAGWETAASASEGGRANAFDLIVLDPPFPQYRGGISDPWALARRLAETLLATDGTLAIEFPEGLEPPPPPPGFTILAQKGYGGTQLVVWTRGGTN